MTDGCTGCRVRGQQRAHGSRQGAVEQGGAGYEFGFEPLTWLLLMRLELGTKVDKIIDDGVFEGRIGPGWPRARSRAGAVQGGGGNEVGARMDAQLLAWWGRGVGQSLSACLRRVDVDFTQTVLHTEYRTIAIAGCKCGTGKGHNSGLVAS